MNWRGRALVSHEIIVNSIAAVTTRTGLTVNAELDAGTYAPGAAVSDAEMDALPIARHPWHGSGSTPCSPPRPPRPHSRCARRAWH